jgi:hypothetical protein
MNVSDKTGLPPLLIKCSHGERPSAVVCGHMLNAEEKVVGFVENSSDPTDLQAWCEACEQLFLEEGGKTARFLEFNQMSLVCDCCYANLKARHFRSEGAL